MRLFLPSRLFLLFLLLIFSTPVLADSCDDWEKLFVPEYFQMSDMAHDKYNNAYVVGTYGHQDLVIGAFTFKYNRYGTNSVLIKLDKDLNVLWASQPETMGWAMFMQVEIDTDNSIVASGIFGHAPISFGGHSAPDSGEKDLFVVKYSSGGTPLWVTGSTGVSNEEPSDLAISANHDIAVSGSHTGTGVAIGGKAIQSYGGFDSFVALIRGTDGKVAWAKGFGGADSEWNDNIEAIDTDSENNVVFTGHFGTPEIVFGGFTIHQQGVENYFVVKMSASGDVLWAKEGDGQWALAGWDIAVGKSDNIFVLGYFDVGVVLGGSTLHSRGSRDVFIEKIDPSGNTIGGEHLGGSQYDWGTQIDVDANGRVVVAGFYYGKFIAGPFEGSYANLDESNGFVVEYGDDLMPLCAHFVTGSDRTELDHMSIDLAGNIWILAHMDIFTQYKTLQFDTKFTSKKWDAYTFMAVIGANDTGLVEPPATFTVSLGPDILKCSDTFATLKADFYPGATYAWSTGSTDQAIDVIAPGIAWVDVIWLGRKVRDSVTIANRASLTVTLGADQTICPGNAVAWSLPAYADATYTWSDGDTAPLKTVTEAGFYSVDLTNVCETVSASATVSIRTPPVADLGGDRALCTGDELVLRYAAAEDVSFKWSDGSASPTFVVSKGGTYSLTASNACQTISSSIVVTENTAPPGIDLGGDQTLCSGRNVLLHYDAPKGVTFHWSDGSNAPTLTVAKGGVYSLTASTVCGTTSASVTISEGSAPQFSLGEDQTTCHGEPVALHYDNLGNDMVRWSNGSNANAVTITQSGTYSLRVTNACGTTDDEVAIVILDIGNVKIPNVITPNGDTKNEHFVLPDVMSNYSLKVFDRWGDLIYHAPSYQNDWPQQTQTTGVYYYMLNGECFSKAKGSIHVVN